MTRRIRLMTKAPKRKSRMRPVRTAAMWRGVYLRLYGWYVKRARQAVIDRATHWSVT